MGSFYHTDYYWGLNGFATFDEFAILTRWFTISLSSSLFCRFHLACVLCCSCYFALFCSFRFVWFSFWCFMYYCPAENALKWSVCSDKMCNYNVADCGHPFIDTFWEVRTVDTLCSLPVLRIVDFYRFICFCVVFHCVQAHSLVHNVHTSPQYHVRCSLQCSLDGKVFALTSSFSLSLSVLIF